MPESAVRWYKMWLASFPQSWHPSTVEFFYMFSHVSIKNSKKKRSRYWLKKNLQEDCPKLSENDIEKYCDIYEHLIKFCNVWKSDLAKLVTEDDFEKRLAYLRSRKVSRLTEDL